MTSLFVYWLCFNVSRQRCPRVRTGYGEWTGELTGQEGGITRTNSQSLTLLVANRYHGDGKQAHVLVRPVSISLCSNLLVLSVCLSISPFSFCLSPAGCRYQVNLSSRVSNAAVGRIILAACRQHAPRCLPRTHSLKSTQEKYLIKVKFILVCNIAIYLNYRHINIVETFY